MNVTVLEPITYEEVDILVDNYKEMVGSDSQDCPECLSKLINSFNGYILKWVNLLSGANPNMLDGESVAFMSMFGRSNLYSAVDTIRECYGNYSEQELYSEVLIQFIDTVMRYERVKYSGFTNYLVAVFKFRLYRMVVSKHKETIKDNNSTRLHPTVEAGPDIELPDYDHNINLLPDVVDIYYNRADLPCLTNSEKNILSLFMRDGYQGVADTLGNTRRSAVEKVAVIKKKLRRWLNEQSLSD
jgi:hypothetical protein